MFRELPKTHSATESRGRQFTLAEEAGDVSLYIRSYWADTAILDSTWPPPTVAMVK